ncbi:unnamed protein product [Agarophyton chilense]|eukprot:gb/GEZJ01000643.1/.p1 GENE.gb/GEZJ01000643.1/~~gb/GEZJ01000643.1/.p1  ORF type:complete len:813 (+),score=124.95 gb/GEZJ01000643.1/:1258-3696(+)
MADRNAEPSSTSAPDAPSPISKNEAKDEPQYQDASGESSQNNTSQVRISVLEAIANHQKQRISELERTLEKKRATIQRLSATPPLPHPTIPMVPAAAMPTVPTIPTSAQVPPAPSSSPQVDPAPTSGGATVSSQAPTPSASQPQPSASTGATNHVMTAPMLGFPPHSHVPPYPFMFPPPDPCFAAQYMGVMPPAVLHPAQALNAQLPSQTNPRDKGNDSQEQKQSRYWTPDEHERFLAGMKACGPKNYLQISEYVGTRNAKQVRTHAQKYQKRLEREDAKRRSDMRHGRVSKADPTDSVAEDAAAAVKAAAAAAICGKVPGTTSAAVKDSDSAGTPAGPSSSSSGKQFHSSHQHSQGASSGDGSISVNTASVQHADTNGTKNRSAAMAAIAAEAKALGHGVLPLEAINISSHSYQIASQPTMVNKNTGSVEDEKESKNSRHTRDVDQTATRIGCEHSASMDQKGYISKSKQKQYECPETTETSRHEIADLPTAGESMNNNTRKTCTETSLQGDNGGVGVGKETNKADLLPKEAMDNNTETEEDIVSTGRCCKDVAKTGQDPLLSRMTEAGNKQDDSEKLTAGSVVHTKLTNTTAKRVNIVEGMASETDGGMSAVKLEPERIGSCTNLGEKSNARAVSNTVGNEGSGGTRPAEVTSLDSVEERREGKSHEVAKVDAESKKLHQSQEEKDRAKKGGSTGEVKRNSDDDRKQSVEKDARRRGHGAHEEGDFEDELKRLATGDEGGTALEVDGNHNVCGADNKKRVRDAEETGMHKRARKDDGVGRKVESASDRDGGTRRPSETNGGTSTAATKLT